MLRQEKVLNVGECHYKHIMLMGDYHCGAIYGYNSLINSTKLNVHHVQIIRNNTITSDGGVAAAARQVSGTLLAGVIGFLFMAPHTVTTWDMDLDIYTTDGQVIELWTSDPNIIKFLSGYMTAEDPRDKFRKQRGVM